MTFSAIHRISVLVFTMLCLSCPVSAQVSAQPEKVYRLCYVEKSQEFYAEQAELWRLEIDRNPAQEEAWRNYFFATRYATLFGDVPGREAILDSLIREMGQAIPDSYVYQYILYYNYGNDYFQDLQKAYQSHPDEPDIHWEMIRYYKLTGDQDRAGKYCTELYRTGSIAPGIYDLNYNILKSTSPGAVLFTNGDNDTYPAWVLQLAKGICDDVLILNVHGIFGDRNYLELSLQDCGLRVDVAALPDDSLPVFFQALIQAIRQQDPGIPIYIAATVYPKYYHDFKDNLYLVGLAYLYATEPFDPIPQLEGNLVDNFRLDYLNPDSDSQDHVSQPLVDRLNLLYIDPFLEYAKYCAAASDLTNAHRWKDKALSLAVKADHEESIDRIKKVKF